ncbi:MAG: MBL fold metallo-hydrolase [Eubacteriales bacterium]|nr:MBL fold metallo-hydrolase [Eubacteriales bacterium]
MVERLWDDPQIYRWSASAAQTQNCYLLVDRQQVLAIDPMLHEEQDWQALERAIGELPGAPTLRQVLLTHLYSDWMAAASGAGLRQVKLLVSQTDRRLSGQKEPWEYQRRWYRREGFPARHLKDYNGEDVRWSGRTEQIATVEPGEIVTVGSLELHCLRLPGHTPGHTALGLPTKSLAFSGDTLLLDGLPYIGAWKGHPHALEQYLAGLELLRGAALQTIFPAHGAWGALPPRRIDDVMRHYYLRLIELYQLVLDHPGLTAYELAARFRWRQQPWDTLSIKEQWFAMGETLAHLIYLRDRRYVETKSGEGSLINVPGAKKLTDM